MADPRTANLSGYDCALLDVLVAPQKENADLANPSDALTGPLHTSACVVLAQAI